jgi:RNA polymerase sigma-70 factor (ECF subfamily)
MAMTIDDPRLIESFRAGENDAFEALVRAHRPALYRHALRKLSDHAAAEDAVQETFMRAYKARARVNDDWQLRPWLHQICANVCIDEANRRRKEATKTSRWAIVDMPTRGIAPELEKELGLDTDHSEMTAAILSLPAKYQEALSMRYVEELEYDEIAEILDISEQNARARVSRASKAVRVLLRPVAAIIAFLAVIFGRRAPKAAIAATADPTTAASVATTATHTATAATQVAQTATVLTPLIETAQAVAVAAPAAAPMLSKAAIGVTMIVAATAPVTATVVIDQIRPTKSAPTTVAPAVTEATDVAAPVVVGTKVEDGLVADAPASIGPRDNSASASKGGSTDDTRSSVPVADGTTNDLSTSGGSADYPVTDDATGDDVTEPDPTVTPAPVRSGGTLQVVALTVTSAGSRLDLSGQAGLVVGGTTIAGTLSGRVALGAPGPDGRQRLDGTLSVATNDENLEFRLSGFATADPDTPDQYTVSGLFRSSGSDELLQSGTMGGSLGSSLALTLRA